MTANCFAISRRFVPHWASAIAFTASVSLIGPAANAQDADGRTAGQIEELKQCRAVLGAEERLACYDRVATALVAASEAGEVKLVSVEEVEQTKRGLFGFSLPKIGLFSSTEDELSQLESEITSVRSTGRDSFEFRITEGSLWRISNAPSRLRTPRPGDSVVFRKAALGSYFIRINGTRGVKGRRVE